MRSLLTAVTLCLGFAFAQPDLSTPGGASVLATFVTDPPEAEVYVAGTFIGTSPATVRINANIATPYTVRVPSGGFEVFSGTVTLGQASVTEVYVPRVTQPRTNLPRSPTAPGQVTAPAPPTGTDSVDLLLRLAACAELSDSLARLTCYDRLTTEYGLSGYAPPTDASPTTLGTPTTAPEAAEPTSPRNTPAQGTPAQNTLVRALPPQDAQAQSVSEVEPEPAPAPIPPRASLFDLARDGSYDEVYAAIGVGEDVNASDAYGQTVLMYAAAGNEDPNVHATLVASGANIDARSLARWTALMYAARDNPNPEVVVQLLELGADPSRVNSEGRTALDLARSNPALRNSYVLDRLESLTVVAPPPEPMAVPQAAPSAPPPPPAPVSQSCCKYCRKGYACGNTCIARNKTCHAGVGCACNAGVGTDDSLIAAEEQFFVGLESDFDEPFVAGVCGEALQLSLALP